MQLCQRNREPFLFHVFKLYLYDHLVKMMSSFLERGITLLLMPALKEKFRLSDRIHEYKVIKE